jgi:hypothetical protein
VQIGSVGQIALVAENGSTIDFPPADFGWGFDFNPTVEPIRVVAGMLNFRINSNSGTAVDGNGAAAGVQPDTNLVSGGLDASGAAYTSGAEPFAGVTTLYTLLASSFTIQAPANSGTLPPTPILGITGLGEWVGGFDIPATVRAPAADAPVTSGSAFLGGTSLSAGTRLWQVNLVSGAGTDLGLIGNGSVALGGLTVGQATVR